MARFVLASAVAVLVALAVPALADHCASAPNCQACVDRQYCGWCSTNTTLPDGSLSAQCAGFTPGQPYPFQCDGVFSIENCAAGYTCSQETFQCVSAGPGNGVPLSQCQANCTNNGQTYLCNKTSYQCYVVPPGTPNSASLEVCSQSCVKPDTATASASPASHNPVPPPTTVALWGCNYTSGQCVPSTPGTGTSLSVCQQQCQKGKVTYYCNPSTHQCLPLPPSTPSGLPLAQCEAICSPSPAPGPPPGFPVGLYRGLMISNGYKTGVVYVDVRDTTFTMVTMKGGRVESYLSGTPSHLPPSTENEHPNILEVTITSPARYAGQTLATISDLTGLPGPETTFITMAYAAQLGSPAPQTVTGAMTNPAQHVLALAKCQTPECKFNLPALPRGGDAVGAAATFRLLPHEVSETGRARSGFSDICSSYGQSCAVCLQQPTCGWCSTNVSYITGETGSQCAGFNTGTNTTAWVCNGEYSTLACAAGYTCNSTTAQCLVAPPGDGVPLQQCEAQCRVTMTPAPPQKQYVCNVTLKQCFACNRTSCAGGMPLAQCTAACQHPKPGPPSHLVGVWRGFYIQAGYRDVEVAYVFKGKTLTAYRSGDKIFEASVISYGNNLLIIDYTSGRYKGFKRALLYQESSEVPNGLYESITLAEGKIGGSAPESFPPAMVTPGMGELVFYKCATAPCVFRAP
jgi:hypothetical protein